MENPNQPKTETSNSDYVLCRILIPKKNEKTPAAAELFFAALHGIYDYTSKFQPTISFEIVSINKFIQFYFYAPRYLKEFIESQFYAQYPDVEISEAEDYTTKLIQGKAGVGVDLQTTKRDIYPIKTFQSFDVDPLSSITSILSQLDQNEELWIQICISPVDDKWQKQSEAYVASVKAGHNPDETILKTIGKGVFSFLRGLAESVQSPTESQTAKTPEISAAVQAGLGGIESKATKLGFQTKIRIVSLSDDPNKARQRLNSVLGAFKQFNQTQLNGFIHGKILEKDLAIQSYQKRQLGPKPYILNIEELASIYHLPAETVETPSMDYAGSRKGEPPQNLPLAGTEQEDQISIIGKTNFRGTEKLFGIKIPDRALHIYSIGKTGTGKSTLLKQMIIDDICKGRGVAVADPHGDLINDVLEYIPENRVDDVVYFSPADREYPIGFNLFENVSPEYKNIVASGIVSVFKKIFGESWGPRLEYILRNVVLGLLDYPGATLLSVLKVLNDTKFRRGVVEKITDPVIRDFFINEYERYDQKFRTEAVAPIQNKVGQFLSSTIIRNIVGQKNSCINIRKIMDEKKILLIDLSIGKIGEDNSALLGSLMITKIQMSAMGRADIPKEKRVPFYLYVDEFQNFATDSFAVILSEARKYGLSLTVTNQYIAQMSENVANAIFGNVGTLITFRVGAKDAEFLNKEFVPVFEPSDLTNLSNYNIYLKMSIDGVTSAPFSAKTVLPEFKKTNIVEKIINQSRSKYSRPRDEVEKEIEESTAAPKLPEEVLGPKTDESQTPQKKAQETETREKDENIQTSTKPSNLPEELSNVREIEDYNLNKWYYLTRTGFKKVTGQKIDDETTATASNREE